MASAIAPSPARTTALPTTVNDWRQSLAQGRAELRAACGDKPNATSALQRQCALVDEALLAIWSESGQSGELALIAVGGYGRGMLYPYSDVDVLVLLPDEAGDKACAGVESLVGMLWDIGLEIRHIVRTTRQCQQK